MSLSFRIKYGMTVDDGRWSSVVSMSKSPVERAGKNR